MQKSILGIDIGSFNIKVVEAIPNNGKMELLNYAITKTPENTVNDGKIMDIDKVAEAIGNLLTSNFIKTKKVVSIISSSALLTREVNIPKMKELEIAKYIHIDSQQYFPVNLDDYILDFKILEETSSIKGSEYSVLLVAVPQNIVVDYIKVFDKLKMDMQAIDISSNVLSKFMKNISVNKLTSKKEGLETYAIIDLGAKSTTVSIISNGILQFSRSVPNGSDGITQNIANTFNLNMNEAEEYKLKNAEVILEAYRAESLSNNISDVIKPVLDGIASYINKFFEFYCSRSSINKINTIYLTGGGSLLRGVEEYYRTLFNIPTRKVNLSDGIIEKSNKPTIQRDLPLILNAFSATYRE